MSEETEETQEAAETMQRLTALAKLAAAHSIGEREALAQTLREARADGISWDASYEALLQLVAYTGYPRTLNALYTYRAVSGVPTPSEPTEPWHAFALETWPTRGAEIFRQLWPTSEVAASIRSLSPELAEWVINDDLGRIFGRAGLTLIEREAVVLGSLIAQRAAPELCAHRRAFLAVGGSDTQLDELVMAVEPLVPAEAMASAQSALVRFRAEQ